MQVLTQAQARAFCSAMHAINSVGGAVSIGFTDSVGDQIKLAVQSDDSILVERSSSQTDVVHRETHSTRLKFVQAYGL